MVGGSGGCGDGFGGDGFDGDGGGVFGGGSGVGDDNGVGGGISQLFQSPSLVRDPEKTNHTQNEQQGGKVELGLQLQLFPAYIY